jgi:formylglycine-generating enzyme required for sulfatase activity
VQNAIQVKVEHDNSPSWVLLSLSRDNGRKAGASPWASNWVSTYRGSMLAFFQGPRAGAIGAGGGTRGPFVQGVAFRAVPSGTLVMGNDEKPDNFGRTIDQSLAHPVLIDAFYLAETEVTNRQFQAFLAENGEWLPSNRDALASRKLVTEQYLAGWTGDRPPAGTEDLPVTGISWHAATAYCQWLSTRASGAVPGYVVRLPTEPEWEWAARGGLRSMPYPTGEKPGAAVLFTKGIAGPSRAGTSEPNAWGLRDMVGNAWEWCADSYAPAAYLLSSLDPKRNAELAAQLPASNDKVVRGGSWNNARDQVKVYTRGSQPAEWCTPYLGFRVALARR